VNPTHKHWWFAVVLRRIQAYALLMLIVFAQAFLPLASIFAQQPQFTLIGYSYKSSANTEAVYPGSRDILLTVNIQYSGDSSANIAAGCLELPQGFTVTRGYSGCVAPEAPNGSTHTVAEPGDVLVFEYHIDVEGSTQPGVYTFSIAIHYSVGGSTATYTVGGIQVEVSPYPQLEVEVVDWYWSPDAYPGSEGVYLYIVLKNVGASAIVQASGVAELPQGVFEPSSNRFQIASLGKNQSATVALGPLSVNTSARPDTDYIVSLSMNATMSTDDGVVYSGSDSTTFYVRVSPAPVVELQVVDYGLETPRPAKESTGPRFYMTVVNKDFKTVRSITAYFTVEEGAHFYNGSTSAVVVIQQAIGYGGTVTLYSPRLVLGDADAVVVSVKLVVFGDDGGAEFWSEQIYVFRVSLEEPSVKLAVMDVYWASGEVYPGTEGATLVVDLANLDVVDVRDATVTLQLSGGFYPLDLTLSGISVQSGSVATLRFSGISIGTNAMGGEYPARLVVKGVAYDPPSGTFYSFTVEHTVSVRVSTKPYVDIFSVTGAGWAGGRAYTTSVGAYAYAYLRVSSPGYSVESIRIESHLPRGMVFESGNRSSVTVLAGAVYSYGQSIYVEIGPIDMALESGGLYPLVLEVECLATAPGGGSYWFTGYYTVLLPVYRPALNLTLAGYGWADPLTGAEASGASLYVTLQSLSIDSVQSIVAEALLVNARFLDGGNRSVQVFEGGLGYGSLQTLVFSYIEVPGAEHVEVVLTLYAVLSTGRGLYRASARYTFSVATAPPPNTFRVVALYTSVGGVYAPVLPSARGVTITVELSNAKAFQVAWAKPEVILPQGLKLNSVGGTCLGGAAPGGTCSIDVSVDVSPDVGPGAKNMTIVVEYAARVGQVLSVFRESIEVPIAIASYSYYRPSIDLLSAYWGLQAPARALAGERNVPLTVEIVNRGYHAVEGVYVSIEPMMSDVALVKNTSLCSPRLDPGSMCSATLYVDLAAVAGGGHVAFRISVGYTFRVYGANIDDAQHFVAVLPIEEPASGRGLRVVDVSWSNGWPVYPNTENATLVVTMANRWPYRVSGIELQLELPQGMRSRSGPVATAYIPGPVGSLQQFTASFLVSVGDVRPGRYSATLVASYVVESGTPNTRVVERFAVDIAVNSLEDSVSLVSVQWVGRSPQPPEYGALLMIVVRNNYNPVVRGAVLDISLPSGFTASDTNTSRTSVVATNVNIVQQLQSMQIPPAYMQYIASQLLQQITAAQVQGFGYGDLMYFYVKVNIVTSRTGVYVANATLDFVDQWNNVRRVPLSIAIGVLGSTKIVEVVAPATVRVSGGIAVLEIGLVNRGSSPLYNVYVYLVPYASMLIPRQPVRYIDSLPPNKVVNTSFELVYNPIASIGMGGVPAYLRYATAPFALTVVYRDVYGNTQFFNTSIALLVEPFIDLGLSDTMAVLSGATLSVSGTVVNYGIAPARSVVVRALYGNKSQETFIGDLDPASQAAFRIEIDVGGSTPSEVALQIVYRDEYGRESISNYTVPVFVRLPTETPTAPAEQIPAYSHYIIIVATAAFLAATGYALYRYVRAHARALESSVAEIERR